MHEKDPFSEFREFINTMESRVQEFILILKQVPDGKSLRAS